jgi:hypothetical protein
MTLDWTMVGLVLSLLISGVAALMERRPRQPGKVHLVPWTGILAVSVVAAFVFARHLLSFVAPGLPARRLPY